MAAMTAAVVAPLRSCGLVRFAARNSATEASRAAAAVAGFSSGALKPTRNCFGTWVARNASEPAVEMNLAPLFDAWLIASGRRARPTTATKAGGPKPEFRPYIGLFLGLDASARHASHAAWGATTNTAK